MPIRILSQNLINQIAAGEVVERPHSVVKELVENALDAGAKRIDISLADGGKSLITIDDDGIGMAAEELFLAVERHATSKLDDENLFAIKTLGFRGEALPSIGSVARLEITTRSQSSDNGYKISVEGGLKSDVSPASRNKGTRVEVRDLFYATPARLKFLKTSQTETRYTVEIVNSLALAQPTVSFSLSDEKRKKINLPAQKDYSLQSIATRAAEIIGSDFATNSVPVNSEGETISIRGYCSLPTFTASSPQNQFIFVNNRAVKDKILTSALRAAYQDLAPHGRYPQVVIFIDVAPSEVDVNVHPAKTEVRFRDAGSIRGALIASIRASLSEAGHKTSSAFTIPQRNSSFSYQSQPQNRNLTQNYLGNSYNSYEKKPNNQSSFNYFEKAREAQAPLENNNQSFQLDENSYLNSEYGNKEQTREYEGLNPEYDLPLGCAICQIANTYIVAKNANGIVVIDQHAAHERLVFEKIKANLLTNTPSSQQLLLPEVVEMESSLCEILCSKSENLAKIGLVLESFGDDAVIVRATPSILKKCDLKSLIIDLANEFSEWDKSFTIEDKLSNICATFACHSSIRAGRKLNIEEMNALLRQMESTPFSAQCGHGRPTSIELGIKELEKLFGRT
ncbi:MAG: DNA mismatch repair endonuclease MutL [Alphaproteobacteria bacterium]